jgi:acyl carrier protein
VDQDIERTVKQILADKLEIRIEEIGLSASLSNDLGVDSLGAIEIAFELEEKFGLSISDDESRQMNTVQDIIGYIKSKL